MKISMEYAERVLATIGAIFIMISSGQSHADLCAGCKMVNGAGYNKHPTDCDKFVHCRYGVDGSLIGQLQQCSFSTYWDEKLMTCSPANITSCDNDICKDQPNGKVFGARGNCRGLWQCYGGKAEAMCCPYGQKYTVNLGCVDNEDDECLDKCFNEVKMLEVCDKRAVVGKPRVFQQKVSETVWVEMPCAHGTAFVEDACLCLALVDTDMQQATCKPEIYLPFSKNHLDESGNGYFVANENVLVHDGVAEFNGQNSRLIIPRFTNLEHSTTVIIKIKYSSKHADLALAQAMVSNSDCKNVPSIMLSEDYANVYFGVGTSDVKFAYAYVPQEDSSPATSASEKEVMYKFDGGELAGFNGNATDVVTAPGFLRNVHCALHVGYAENLRPFKGEIDELTVYLCNPDKQ